jgi:hypothetical protein
VKHIRPAGDGQTAENKGDMLLFRSGGSKKKHVPFVFHKKTTASVDGKKECGFARLKIDFLWALATARQAW